MAEQEKCEEVEIELVVDYRQSLGQMISANCCDWVNGAITPERFPIKECGFGVFEVRYFRFDGYISSDDAIAQIKLFDGNSPWAPARIEHLLSLGQTFPEEQKKFPIVGLSPVEIGGIHYVPYIGARMSRRRISLDLWLGEWASVYRFLAIRRKLHFCRKM